MPAATTHRHTRTYVYTHERTHNLSSWSLPKSQFSPYPSRVLIGPILVSCLMQPSCYNHSDASLKHSSDKPVVVYCAFTVLCAAAQKSGHHCLMYTKMPSPLYVCVLLFYVCCMLQPRKLTSLSPYRGHPLAKYRNPVRSSKYSVCPSKM